MTTHFCNHCQTRHDFCDCCGIAVGTDHLEKSGRKIGDNTLCYSCYAKVKEHGMVELDRHGDGNHPTILWLRKDGTVIKEIANFAV